MKRTLLSAAVVAGLVAVTAPAQAQDLRFYGGTATFMNMTWDVNNGAWGQNAISSDPRELYWGGSSSTGSKYGFNFVNDLNGIEPDACSPFCGWYSYENLDLTPGPTLFKLGTFRHTNRTINIGSTGTVLNSVDLSFNLQFDANQLGSNPLSIQQSASFFIDHSETPNPSGDNISFVLPGATSYFSYAGYDYGLRIFGMKRGSDWINSLSTPESHYREADVYAEISRVSTVPEPSTYALMAAGLMALGMVSRRRRKA